jgi:chorismate-pyruvate lyase
MQNFRRLILTLALLCAAVLPDFASPQTTPAWPDTFLARVEALALVESLNATLLASRSATFTLDKWCADHKLGGDTTIRARLVRDIDKPAMHEQRRRLQIDETEPVKFRHVELRCGDRILSEADNWYVPSRLTAEMNRQLETTDAPFGRVVADLKPFRQTFAAEMLWKPLDDGWEQRPPTADHPQQAFIVRCSMRPISSQFRKSTKPTPAKIWRSRRCVDAPPSGPLKKSGRIAYEA